MRLDIAPGNVSRIMTELERSLAQRRDGRRVRYFIASATGARTEPAGEPEPEEMPAEAPPARLDPADATALAGYRISTAEAARDSTEKRADHLEARLEETNQVLGRWRDRAIRAEKAEDELRRYELAGRRNRALAAILILILAAGAGAWWVSTLPAASCRCVAVPVPRIALSRWSVKGKQDHDRSATSYEYEG